MKAQLTEARDEKERVEKERERLERELNDVKQENRGEYELMLRHKDERIAELEGALLRLDHLRLASNLSCSYAPLSYVAYSAYTGIDSFHYTIILHVRVHRGNWDKELNVLNLFCDYY